MLVLLSMLVPEIHLETLQELESLNLSLHKVHMEGTIQVQDKNLELSQATEQPLISSQDQRYMLVEDSMLVNTLDQPLETFLGSAPLIIWVLDFSSVQLAILEHVKLLEIL